MFLLDSAGYCQAVVFNALMVPPSLLKMLISPSKHVTLIFVKSWLAPSPQFTYSVIHAQTNTRIHACLECPRSAGLTGMNERGALAPRPSSFPRASRSLALALSLACLLARSFRLPRGDSLATLARRPSPSSTRAASASVSFSHRRTFQRSAHHQRESISLFGGQEVPAQIANRKSRHTRYS